MLEMLDMNFGKFSLRDWVKTLLKPISDIS
jgi:hypothetical protein